MKTEEPVSGVFWRRLIASDMIIAFSICLLTAGIFALLANEVVFEKEDWFDQQIFAFLNVYVSDGHTLIARGISFFGTGTFLVPAYLFIFIFFLKTGRKREGVHVLVVAVFSFLLGLALKEVFRRPRPSLPRLEPAGGWSFPSGHTLGGFTFCAILIYFVVKSQLSVAKKVCISILLFVFACLIGISRIYLHTHYASDTMASMFAAICWLSLFYLFALRKTTN